MVDPSDPRSPARFCAHADQNGEGAHWLTAGETCEVAATAGLAAMMRGEAIEVEPIDADGNVIGPAETVPSPASEPEQRRRQADLN